MSTRSFYLYYLQASPTYVYIRELTQFHNPGNDDDDNY